MRRVLCLLIKSTKSLYAGPAARIFTDENAYCSFTYFRFMIGHAFSRQYLRSVRYTACLLSNDVEHLEFSFLVY